MTTYSPSTLFLKELHDRLEVLAIPIYFKLPNSDVLEPFIVIGSNSSDMSQTAQTGAVIEDITVNIDIFLDSSSRTDAEEIKSKALRALGRRNATANIIPDNSIGREVYHVSIAVSDTIY
ncbi:hypothetical protein SAMN05660328_11510 [Streptococcus gallolyticus]|uniref:Phage protein n=1 Tax=Streptococcus gallolyticus TaxID=315405 RepID=A0A1I7JLB8_9STRE|nr:hypothetical protein [Streptococcus gallolyticus]SFC84973.1 hypothetical protein SAMN02983012_0020 [Streptococcus gallolyticus]SFU85928.1 hypothetical protein SAMN05660328_11510 [Streptococcus gallolyticus]